MKLDMDKYVAAMTPPVLVVGDVEYKASALLKFNDAVRLQHQLAEGKSGEAILAVAREVCDLVGVPADVVLALPGGAVMKVIHGFFESAYQSPDESA